MPGFSVGVASLIGYPLVEDNEEMKKNKSFRSQSHKLQTISPTACDAVTEIVDSAFENMLDSHG